MTYKELYEKALWDLEHDKITLGEFDDMVEPLNKEIPKENNDNDLVSRKAVIDMMNKIFFDNDFAGFRIEYGSQGAMYYAINYVKELPSYSAEQTRWIPVSEKLPEIQNYSDNYLVTLKRGGVHIAMFTECDGKHWWTYDDVKAWMALPEPYKVESEE